MIRWEHRHLTFKFQWRNQGRSFNKVYYTGIRNAAFAGLNSRFRGGRKLHTLLS
jgi:hypothetical protein